MKHIIKLYLPAIFAAGLSVSQSVTAMEVNVEIPSYQNQKELILHSLLNQFSAISRGMVSGPQKTENKNPSSLAFKNIKAQLTGQDYFKLALSLTGFKLDGRELLSLAYVCRATYLPCLLSKNEEFIDFSVFPDFSVQYNGQDSSMKEKSDENGKRISSLGEFDDVDSVSEELLFNRSMTCSTDFSDFSDFDSEYDYSINNYDVFREDLGLSEHNSFHEMKGEQNEYDRRNPRNFSPNPYRIKQTLEVNEENLARNYKQWHDIPNFTPQRTFWMNDNFIELLGLLINLKCGRGNNQDRERCDIIFNRFKKSALPKTSVLMEYVDYLSIDPLRRLAYFTQFDLPKLKSYTEKEGYDNEKAVYLYHTYLDGKKPNIKTLLKDPLFYQVEGGIGAFIRSQRILHPIRLKKGVNIDDIELLVALDYGITRKDMEFIFAILIEETENPRFSWLIEHGLEKLVKYASKHVPAKHNVPSKDMIALFRQKAEKRVFARFLHFTLKARTAAGKIVNEVTYLEACNLLKELGYQEMSYFHVEQILEIHERINLLRQAERAAALGAIDNGGYPRDYSERTIWRGP